MKQFRPKQSKDPGGTPAQLREDIQGGQTGDKVKVRDPAAAPLGTDEEAAGTPVPPIAARHARDAERKSPLQTDPDRSNKYNSWSGVLIWIGAVAVLVFVFASALLLMGPLP
jgi:hypothetical protein